MPENQRMGRNLDDTSGSNFGRRSRFRRGNLSVCLSADGRLYISSHNYEMTDRDSGFCVCPRPQSIDRRILRVSTSTEY